ncbi:uncharacterized protein ISCGN_008696 [Ixodes scapularis]
MPKTRHHAYCSARWCSNSGAKGSVKFFRLPKDERCDKWLAYANREDLAGLSREQLNKSHRLCSEHFTDEAYADPQKTKLLREALPSVKVTDERFRFLASEEALQVDDNDSGDLGGCAQEAGSASPTDLDTDAPLEAMRGAEGQNQPQGTGDTPALSSTPTTSIPQGGEQTTGSPSTPQPGPSADFIERMDKLFDCLNSNSSTAVNGKMNYAISANSEHLEFLQEAVKWIASWRFDSPRQPHTIRGWLVTIRAVLMLWEDLSQNFNFTCLLTRHLQQDPLENLFGSLRMKHGSNEHPNVLQFIAALKHVSVGKLFTLTSRGNCEVHDSYMLARLSQGDPAQALDIQEVDVPTGEMSGEDLPDITEENVLYCFAGNLVQQFLKSRPTDCACERLLKERGSAFTGSHQTLAMLQAHGKPGGLFADLTPSSAGFFEAVKRWKNVF